jgi:probable HAF family extracellular repeat protein
MARINPCGSQSAIRWNAGGQVHYLDLNDLVSTLPPYQVLCSQVGQGINDAGDVVGIVHVRFVSGDSENIAFISTSNGLQAIGELPFGPFQGNRSSTEAHDINNEDEVVGMSNGHAFVWKPNGVMTDLHTVLDASGIGWTLVSAYAINDAGQIVGYGQFNGKNRAFLLTPTRIFPQ